MRRNHAHVSVRPLTSPEEMRDGVQLYRDVFELEPTDPAVSPRILASLPRNGGTVLGAYAEGRMVGFTFGYLGKNARTGEIYHYSQVAAVHPDWQGLGVGRALKLGQREHVLATGVTRMRWTFDPLRAANAHFNLDVLGARGRWFVPDVFGVEDTGRDAGMPSDRLIAEWDLTAEPGARHPARPPHTELSWGEQAADGNDVLLGLPRLWDDVLRGDRDRAAKVRDAVTDVLAQMVGHGYEAVSCVVVGADTAAYRLRPTDPTDPTAEV